MVVAAPVEECAVVIARSLLVADQVFKMYDGGVVGGARVQAISGPFRAQSEETGVGTNDL